MANVPISFVVGSSMGAIIGAAFCAGVSLEHIRSAALRWRLRDFARFSPLSAGFFSHAPLWHTIEELVPARSFEELLTPLRVVCTDLQTGQPAIFESGAIIPPVVGSSIAAGVFEAVMHDGRFLVDGGYTAPLPAQFAPHGLPLITVDPSVLPDREIHIPTSRRMSNLNKIRLVSTQAFKSIDIVLYHLAQQSIRSIPGVYVRPSLADIRFFDLHRASEAIEAGRMAMHKALPLVEEWKDE